MADFNKIKQIMKDSAEKKLVIVDDEDSYVIITLDEYQKLMERSNFVTKIQSKATKEIAEFSKAVNNFSSQTKLAASQEKTTEREILDVNRELDKLTDYDDFEPEVREVRYEKLNNEFSEEPI